MSAAPLDYCAEYDRWKRPLMAAIRRKYRICDDDAEVAYQVAWLEVWLFLRSGRSIDNLHGFLLDVMGKRYVDELRRGYRVHEEAHAGEGEDALALGVGTIEHDPADYDDKVKIRFAAEVIDTELPDARIKAVVYLTFFEGCTRQEAAEEVGFTWSRPLEKRLDRAFKRLREKLGAVKAGEWCEHQRVLIREFAESKLEPGSEPYVRARRHLDGCPACRYYVLTLRGMCAAGPPAPLLAGLALSGIGVAASTAVGTTAGAGAAGAAAAGTAGVAVGAGTATSVFGSLALKAAITAIAVGATTSAIVVVEPGPLRDARSARPAERREVVRPAAPEATAPIITATVPPLTPPAEAHQPVRRTVAARPAKKVVERRRERAARRTAPPAAAPAPAHVPVTSRPTAPPPGVQVVSTPKPVAPPRKDSSGFTSEFSP